VNFALFSENATGVDLCLFDDATVPEPRATIPLRERHDQVWHAYLPDVRPGPALRLSRPRPVQPAEGCASTRRSS
jgi:glycogen operon protein